MPWVTELVVSASAFFGVEGDRFVGFKHLLAVALMPLLASGLAVRFLGFGFAL